MSTDGPGTPPGPKLATSDNFSLSLEILRLMHDAASSRWANRREYEWKLSYAIWTALAGFIATTVLGKDSVFKAFDPDYRSLASWLVPICLSSVIFLHWYYLNGMVARVLNDLDLVDDVEKAILQVDPWVSAHLSVKHLNSTFLITSGKNVRYGLRAQLGITALLSLLACWFCFRERPTLPQPINYPVNLYCPTPPGGSLSCPSQFGLPTKPMQ